MAKILITGGSGLLGRAISQLLLKEGHQPLWLSRSEGTENGIRKFKWNLVNRSIDEKAFEGVEHIIHLAGSGIVDKRWSLTYKKDLLESRVKSSELLQEYILKTKCPLKSFVGGSAIGYYGAVESNHVFTEDDLPGRDFLAETCVNWERSYLPLTRSGIRTCVIRTGIVLSKNGGAYAKMVFPFKLGLGAAVAPGTQAFPWIHIDDIAALFVRALLDEKYSGVYNGVSSENTTNLIFSQQLAGSLKRPFFLPKIPSFILNLVLGERAVTLTKGVFVSNKKLKANGFQFKYEKLSDALDALKN